MEPGDTVESTRFLYEDTIGENRDILTGVTDLDSLSPNNLNRRWVLASPASRSSPVTRGTQTSSGESLDGSRGRDIGSVHAWSTSATGMPLLEVRASSRR